MRYIRLTVNILVLMILLVSFSGCGENYEGDGDLDNGLILHPTFRVKFKEIELGKNSVTTYRFKGVSKDNLKFILVWSNSQERPLSNEVIEEFDKLEESNTKIGLELFANDEKTISIELSPLVKSWTYAAIGNTKYFWNSNLINMSLDPSVQYKLTLTVVPEREGLSNIIVLPILEGGGFGAGDVYRGI